MATVKINALGILGAIVGIAAVFMIWVSASFFIWSANFNLIDLINHSHDATLINACWIFLIGAIVCFITPLGGLLELSGVAMFMMWFTSKANGDMPSNIGPYLGLAAGMIALISIAMPLGPGMASGSVSMKSRLLVFSSGQS
jgi:hypothetical protein